MFLYCLVIKSLFFGCILHRQKRGPKKTPGAGKNKAASHSDEVVFSSSVVQKWQPISSEVSSVFNGILIAALG